MRKKIKRKNRRNREKQYQRSEKLGQASRGQVFVLLRTIYYSRKRTEKKVRKQVELKWIDLKITTVMWKRQKGNPEKHISSRVMSHTKNESWPGIYRKIKKDSIMKTREADYSRKGSYQYSLCRRAFKDKDMRGQQIWCSRLRVMTRRAARLGREQRLHDYRQLAWTPLQEVCWWRRGRQGGNLMKQQDNEHVLLSMRSDAGF